MPSKINLSLSRQSDLSQNSTIVSCGLRSDVPVDVPEAVQHLAQACARCYDLLDSDPADQSGGAGSSTSPLEFADDRLRDRPPATRKQVAYIRRLADEINGLGVERLDVLSKRMCGKMVAEFRDYDARRMIEILKEAKAGRIDLGVMLGGSGGRQASP